MQMVSAKFETAVRYNRQMADVAITREKSAYKGVKPTIDTKRGRALAASRPRGTAIARVEFFSSAYLPLAGLSHPNKHAELKADQCLFVPNII